MASFTTDVVKLRDAGVAGSVCLFAGEQERQPLIYVVDGTPVDIDGWTYSAHGEWRTGQWTDRDELESNGIGAAIEGQPIVDLTANVEIDDNQTANPGQLFIYIGRDLLPDALKDIDFNENTLPTLVAYVTVIAPGDTSTRAQLRAAIGWRRGEKSIVP